jgi:hypothetical protein
MLSSVKTSGGEQHAHWITNNLTAHNHGDFQSKSLTENTPVALPTTTAACLVGHASCAYVPAV